VPFDVLGNQAGWDVAEFGGQFGAPPLILAATDGHLLLVIVIG
jgi:hypothetical protein